MVATTTLPALRSEDDKRRQLTVAKRRATLLLVVVSVVFLALTIRGVEGWVGYVQATAEASMVGALADWFAVVALFRHPLGIPIPHTAVIVERKAQFADTLGSFVQESFLTPDRIVERVRAASVVARAAAWLAAPANATRLAGHVADAAVAGADVVRDEEIDDAVDAAVRRGVESVPLASMTARAIRFLTQEGHHHEVFDAAIRGLDRYLHDNRESLRYRLAEQAPWWLPGAVEDRVFERLFDGVVALIDDAAADPNHELRRNLEERLTAFAAELETSPELAARADAIKRQLLDNPALRDWTSSLWQNLKESLRAQATDPDSELRRRIAKLLESAGEQLRTDPAMAGRVEHAVEDAVRYVAAHFHGEISSLVTSTIDRWDSSETSRRLELLLGADLQYIRINGTVVGGMAGLGLHALTRAIGG